MEWMLMPLRRYAEFSGRSRRKEFWMFQLLNVIVWALLYALLIAAGGSDMLMSAAAVDGGVAGSELNQVSFGPLFWVACIAMLVWALGTLIPSIALTIRRLHDRDMTGWYLLGFIVAVIVVSFIPGIGAIAVFALEIGYIVVMALPGTAGPNQYGPDPLGETDPAVFA